MAQNVTIGNASYTNVPSINIPKTGGGTATFVDVSDTTAAAGDVGTGKYFYTAAGVKTQGTNTGGGGTVMNVQGYHGLAEVASSSLKASGVRLTVEKTGTYKVSWMGARNNTSNTWQTQLYIDGSAYGSAKTSFTRSYAQSVVLTGVQLTAGQTVEVYARSRSTSYYMMVGNLIIEQTA